jgi:two-component system sensor histidine kinase PilS (NtrC family)
VPEAFWRSLGYFNLSRGLLAGLLLAGIHLYADSRLFGANDPAGFQRVCIAYLAVAIGFWWAMRRLRTMFRVHLAVHAITDLVAITLLLHASGGIRSGLGILLLMPLAAAASLSGGRNSLFYAALATFALFVENTYWVLQYEIGWTDYFPVGLLSAGCFTVALVTNRLARRLIANETLVRQRSADLRNQIEINRLVIRDMPNGVLVVDAGGAVRQANPEAERLLGRRGIAGRTLADVAPPLEALAQRWRSAGGSTRAQLEVAGHDVYVRPLNASGGAEDELLLFLEDAGKLKVQAQQVKLAALGRLTANIAHEIRNPLSAISHAAELLAEEDAGGTGRVRLTRIIGDNAARLDRIVQEVLQLNRRDRAVREDVPLAGFVRTFLEQFCQTARLPASSFILRTPASIHASIDRQHLHRILWNLVGNAWRHSRQKDGSVLIELSRNAEDMIELHVVDDGADIGEEQAGKLFEPFFTTDSRGTGLGLYIARELAEANRAALDYVAPAQRPQRDRSWSGADFRLVLERHE